MNLLLSPEAVHDLGEIYDFTAARWGDEQAATYLRRLDSACRDLAANPGKGRRRADVPAPYLVFSVGSHLIIYRIVESRVEVLNILHPAMDLAARLRQALVRQTRRGSDPPV